tara:strand:- start:2210 stop:2395 length:186 start_codon:yes stop_codon:yes gene_type:complete
MKNVLTNIRKIILSNKRRRNMMAALKLGKKANDLNIKSEEYVRLAKKTSKDWEEKWLEELT